VARKVRYCRERILECSATELARRAGVDQQRASRLETGRPVKLDTLAALAAACGRPLGWFLTPGEPDDRPGWLDPELAQALQELGPERRAALLELLRCRPFDLARPAELAEFAGRVAALVGAGGHNRGLQVTL
jgi:transcriptional regulator with XRE-family HTH domain